MELMEKLWNAAKENKQRIVLPEGDEERTLVARKNQKLGLAFPILIGNEEKIADKAKELGVDLTGVEIIDQINQIDFKIT